MVIGTCLVWTRSLQATFLSFSLYLSAGDADMLSESHNPELIPPAPYNHHLYQSPLPLCCGSLLDYLPFPLGCKLQKVKRHVWCPRTLHTQHKVQGLVHRDHSALKKCLVLFPSWETLPFTKRTLQRTEGRQVCTSRRVRPHSHAQHGGCWGSRDRVPTRRSPESCMRKEPTRAGGGLGRGGGGGGYTRTDLGHILKANQQNSLMDWVKGG